MFLIHGLFWCMFVIKGLHHIFMIAVYPLALHPSSQVICLGEVLFFYFPVFPALRSRYGFMQYGCFPITSISRHCLWRAICSWLEPIAMHLLCIYWCFPCSGSCHHSNRIPICSGKNPTHEGCLFWPWTSLNFTGGQAFYHCMVSICSGNSSEQHILNPL